MKTLSSVIALALLIAAAPASANDLESCTEGLKNILGVSSSGDAIYSGVNPQGERCVVEVSDFLNRVNVTVMQNIGPNGTMDPEDIVQFRLGNQRNFNLKKCQAGPTGMVVDSTFKDDEQYSGKVRTLVTVARKPGEMAINIKEKGFFGTKNDLTCIVKLP